MNKIYLIISLVLVVILIIINFAKIYVEVNEVIVLGTELVLFLIAVFSFHQYIKKDKL